MLYLVNVIREMKARETGLVALSGEMRNASNISVVILNKSKKFGDADIDERIILKYLLNTQSSGC
jgi:hypothetical protein